MAGAPKGNKNAANPKGLSKILRQRLEERAANAALMDALIDKALTGDIQAIKEVFDRVDGKPKQSLDVTADVTARSASELSDDELADIAASRRK